MPVDRERFLSRKHAPSKWENETSIFFIVNFGGLRRFRHAPIRRYAPCSLVGIDFWYDQWYYYFMSVAKVTISIESGLLKKVDYLVKERVFSNRSQAIQSAVAEKVSRLDRNRLARECAKMNKAEEQSLADLGLASEVGEWLEY